jgi:hypothetical protein
VLIPFLTSSLCIRMLLSAFWLSSFDHIRIYHFSCSMISCSKIEFICDYIVQFTLFQLYLLHLLAVFASCIYTG